MNEKLILLGIGIIVLFLTGRQIFNWYTRRNEQIRLSRETNNLLRELINIVQDDVD